jgi:pimeloyl-ACP methyl ester carboxylesterase
VEGARRLAVRGFAAFRFDYHGQGDSEGEAGFLDPNEPFREDGTAVLRHLREHLGQRRFVLSGMCFGARTALSTFMDEAASIDALAFVSAPVMDLKQMQTIYAERRGWRQVMGALRDPKRWRELRNPARLKHSFRVLGRMASRRRGGEPRTERELSRSFQEHFDALARSQARALFLYGEDDREYDTFRPFRRDAYPRLSAEVRSRITIEVWPGPVHAGQVEMTRQRQLQQYVLSWIEALHPAGESQRAGTAPAAEKK